jgi:hypothetical protein
LDKVMKMTVIILATLIMVNTVGHTIEINTKKFRDNTINPLYSTSEVHAVGYSICIGLKRMCI